MMRLASVLLVLTLLSTSVISGTFAKYTTADSAQDTARVAKWGVNVIASGSLFGENYNAATGAVDTNEKNNEISLDAEQSVDVAAAGTNIVAPGTQNTTGMTFAIKGTPEVANKVTATSGPLVEEEIWLKEGKYGVMVEAKGVTTDNVTNYFTGTDTFAKATTYAAGTKYYELHDPVTVTETENDRYYPVKWTLAGSATGDKYQLADVVTAIAGAFNTPDDAQNNPNVAIDKSVTLTWAWAFEGQNGADTILGNLQGWANTDNYVVVKETGTDTYGKLTDGEDYNLEIKFDIKIDVTQVD